MKLKPHLSYKQLQNISNASWLKRNFGARIRMLVFTVVACSAAVIMSLYLGRQFVSSFDDKIVSIYELLDRPLQTTISLIDKWSEYLSLADEITILRRENTQLKQELLDNTVLKDEYTKLQVLSKYVHSLRFKYITTKIVSTSIDSNGVSMLVTAGTSNGLAEGQAVINQDGFVGRIVQPNTKSARLLLITNSLSKAPVLLTQSGIHCIAAGDGNMESMHLLYLSSNNNPIIGEQVITSGEGGLIPFGINVGTIQMVNGEFAIKPSAKLANLSFVAVSVEAN